MFQRLGGRKFLLAIIVIGVGTAVEIVTERGVSANFAALLGGIVAAFSAANFAVSREHFKKSVAVNPTVNNAAPSFDAETLDSIKNSVETIASTQQTLMQSAANTQKLTVGIAQNLVKSDG